MEYTTYKNFRRTPILLLRVLVYVFSKALFSQTKLSYITPPPPTILLRKCMTVEIVLQVSLFENSIWLLTPGRIKQTNYLCPGDMAVRMREVLARVWVVECVPLALRLSYLR